jgi:hypothetical protein
VLLSILFLCKFIAVFQEKNMIFNGANIFFTVFQENFDLPGKYPSKTHKNWMNPTNKQRVFCIKQLLGQINVFLKEFFST